MAEKNTISIDDILTYLRKVEIAVSNFEPRMEDKISSLEEFRNSIAHLTDILMLGDWSPSSKQLTKIEEDLREALISLEELSSTRRINRIIRYDKIANISNNIDVMLKERVDKMAINSEMSNDEKNTIYVDEVLSLLSQLEIESNKVFVNLTLREAPIYQRIQSIVQEYNENFIRMEWASSNSQLFEIKNHLINLLDSLKKLLRDDSFNEIKVLTQISHYLDKLFFIINFEKTYQSGISRRLSEQNKELIRRIEETSHELDLQVQNAKKTNELLQSQYEKASSDLQAANLDQLTKLQEQSTNLRSVLEKDVESEINKFNDLVGKANELHTFMQGRALSDFFAKRAVEEKTSAHNWTMATWGFASATLLAIITIFIYQVLYFSPENKADLSLLGTKVLFTATLGLIAKWTSKRSNRHLAEESKYYRLSVNISTIDSFVEKLDEKARNEVLAAVAMKTFTEVNGNETATDFETASVLDVIKSVLPKADGK